MAVEADVPPARFRRRMVWCLITAALVALVVIAAQLVWDMVSGAFGASLLGEALLHYLTMILPISMAAGVFGAAVASYSRWSNRTGEVGVAVLAGTIAMGMAVIVTFIMLWAPLSPAIQVSWVVLLAVASAYGSFRTDRTDVSK